MVRAVFNRLYCCYGIPLCGENNPNLFSNNNAFLVSLLLYQLIKNGSIDPSKCNCWKVMDTSASHLKVNQQVANEEERQI